MSEMRSEANEGQGRGAENTASGPTRRQVLKAAAAATPIIMSIKARPAFAQSTTQTSSALSHNLSAKPVPGTNQG
jgi:hypothetical protein